MKKPADNTVVVDFASWLDCLLASSLDAACKAAFANGIRKYNCTRYWSKLSIQPTC